MTQTQVLPPGYETTFITRTDLADDALNAFRERLLGVIAQFQGEIVINEDLGRKKLAYTIRRETRGHYTYLAYTGKPGVVQELERNLKLQDFVLRFLSVNLAKEFDIEKFKRQREEQKAAAKRREEEREARREERHHDRHEEYDDSQEG